MTLQILSLWLLFSFAINANDQEQDEEMLDEQPVESAAFYPDYQDPEPMLFAQDLDQIPQPVLEPLPLEDEISMPETLDTLGTDDSGNWVLKRVWWEKAEKAFGKVIALTSQISQQQIEYFSARNEIDKQLDSGKRDLILNLPDLSNVISHLLKKLDYEEDLAVLDAKKDSFTGTILENREALMALQASIEQLLKLDSDMDNIIIKVIDQVQKCNDYEANAWQDFKEIGRVLSDDLAKKLYYQVVGYRKNIKLILAYLTTDLKATFENFMAHSVAKLDEIKLSVQILREGGIDLAYESKIMQEGANYTPENSSQEEPAPKKAPKKAGLLGAFINALKMLGNLLLWLPRKLLGWVGIKI